MRLSLAGAVVMLISCGAFHSSPSVRQPDVLWKLNYVRVMGEDSELFDLASLRCGSGPEGRLHPLFGLISIGDQSARPPSLKPAYR